MLTSFAALLLAATTNACAVAPLGWTCAAEKLVRMPENDRALAYLVLETKAAQDIKQLEVDTPSNRCWTAKVAGFEYAMLAMAAPEGSQMRTYFGQVSNAYHDRVHGVTSDAELANTLHDLVRPQADPPSEASMQSAIEGELSQILPGAIDALIANAKTAAAGSDVDCKI